MNIASIAGRLGGAGMAHYNASKAAAINLTQSLAMDLGPSNINVNAVCPGLLWTDMWRSLEAMIGGDATPEVVDRRQVFERLARRSLSVQEIADGMPISRPAVSQHLRKLEQAKLVACRRDGARRVYSVDPRGIEAMRDYLDKFWDRALAAFKAAAEQEDS